MTFLIDSATYINESRASSEIRDAMLRRVFRIFVRCEAVSQG